MSTTAPEAAPTHASTPMASADLRGRITLAIKPHAEAEAKPPFSEEEMVVMALMMHDRPLSEEDVCSWIINNFRHYRDLALRTFFALTHSFHDQSGSSLSVDNETTKRRLPPALDFRRQVSAAFWSFEVPLTTHHVGKDKPQYSVGDVDAEHVLRNVCPANKTTGPAFPFFKLPAELRNSIYEMVFQYPASGVLLRPLRHSYRDWSGSRGSTTVALLNRSLDQPFAFDTWREAARSTYEESPYGDSLLRAGLLSHVLSPLLVSRQFYNEALPIFYGINHFHFPSVGDLKQSLEGLAPNRLQHFARVSLGFGIGEGPGRVSAFRSLAMMTGLRRLDIEVDEAGWRAKAVYDKRLMKIDALNIVGLPALRQVKSDEVHFHGPCPTFEKALKADMTRPKPAKTAPAKSRKRKVGGDGGLKAKKAKGEKKV
ncbi:hypothetical protein LTR36_005000 [Oleoguttula mirabilis]|uniref:DUF7730 domain-containing protein n=1 Tax=Oleoguttula mirabilis TaxID=1507867 RepID=A0AAV9JVE1_9PEZI|nr:hypothetical protein LTR36_005000 [Oleoguttula mirabilis]